VAIRVICKNCHSKIDAKDELLGQTRTCPKCKKPLKIEPESSENDAPLVPEPEKTKATPVENVQTPPDKVPFEENRAENDAILPTPPENQAPIEPPVRTEIISEVRHEEPAPPAPLTSGKLFGELNFQNKYCICSQYRLMAYWELGKGWFYNAGNGFVNAAQNREILPDQGEFTLIEIIVENIEGIKRPWSVKGYALPNRWGLPAIGAGDNAILEKIESEAELSTIQKNLVLGYLRTVYMPEFLYESKKLITYLRDED